MAWANQLMVSKLLKKMWGESYETQLSKESRIREPSQAKCDGFAGARISLAVTAGNSGNAIQTAIEVGFRKPTTSKGSSSAVPIPSAQSTPPFIFGHKEWSIWSGVKFDSPDSAARASSSTCPVTSRSPTDFKGDSVTPVISQATATADQHKECFICPGVTSSLQTPSSIHPRSSPYTVTNELFCPLFFCEFKKSDSEEVHTAFHQCQLDCIAGVESLRALGITDFPIYGLVATGSRASIMMAWHSTRKFTGTALPDEGQVCWI